MNRLPIYRISTIAWLMLASVLLEGMIWWRL
jgi:hypothetical protein